MDIENMDLRPNSHKYRETQNDAAPVGEKKVEKVVTGAVKTKKKNDLGKFASFFISEDAKNVKNYIWLDVLVPTIKNAVANIITDGINIILYGDAKRGKRSDSLSSKVSYRSYYDGRNDRDYARSEVRSHYSYDDIVLESRGEAEDVLMRMSELIDMYGVVSVADLYDLVGITGNYTDNKYGWTNIRNAEAVRVRDGYLLKLPKVLPIN